MALMGDMADMERDAADRRAVQAEIKAQKEKEAKEKAEKEKQGKKK